MPYTLISSVGTGMYDKSKNDATGYRETEYEFANGSRIRSRLFLFSILESKLWDINQVVLVGTRTSSWDALLTRDCELDDEHGAVWLDLIAQCEEQSGGGVTDESLVKLKPLLKQRYGIPFEVMVHDQKIDKETLPAIFSVYNSLPSSVNARQTILLDITHGFRSMPMFLYQSLRFAAQRISYPKIEIIYGEYRPGLSVSTVRDLSLFWELSEVTEALDSFNASFSGLQLANFIQPWWMEGANWMRGFDNLVKSNHVLQIRESIRQLHNAFRRLDDAERPMWASDIINVCKNIYDRFNSCSSMSDSILEFSQMLEEKLLNTQAVIALQIAVETRVVESMYDPAHIGDYDYWNSPGGPKEYKIHLESELRLPELRALEHERNKIAHGGGLDAWKKQPGLESVPSIKDLKKYGSAVKQLFKHCKPKGA